MSCEFAHKVFFQDVSHFNWIDNKVAPIISNSHNNKKTILLRRNSKYSLISPNFLVWTFGGNSQFLHIARNYAETMPFHKISTTGS